MRRPFLVCLAAAGALAAPAAAHAAQSAALNVSAELLEQQVGRPWSINLGVAVEVSTPDGGPPSPLESVDLRFPQGATLNDDRFATCTVQKLEDVGRTACPKDSLIGKGTARADVRPLLDFPIGASIHAYVGPMKRGARTLLFSAVTRDVVNLNLVIEGMLRKTKGRYGYRLTFEVPEINTVPGSPPAAVDLFDVTIDGKVKGRSFIEAPRRCPSGGMPFSGTFGYADGSSSSTRATIGCTLRSTSP